ncbi:hypothetical protein BU15DRAFT_60917 [Melanogaster broomeanus]|nr:hypothetical protein BU15DRAFT_60917 [Melanogaster broomeanus]
MPTTLYGQLCLAAESYQSAIFYPLHAYESCDLPGLGCLLFGYLGRAMQRRSDNRKHLIAQGTAFLSQYRTIRRQDGEHVLPETEFNFGNAPAASDALPAYIPLVSHATNRPCSLFRIATVTSRSTADSNDDAMMCRCFHHPLALIRLTTGCDIRQIESNPPDSLSRLGGLLEDILPDGLCILRQISLHGRSARQHPRHHDLRLVTSVNSLATFAALIIIAIVGLERAVAYLDLPRERSATIEAHS